MHITPSHTIRVISEERIEIYLSHLPWLIDRLPLHIETKISGFFTSLIFNMRNKTGSEFAIKHSPQRLLRPESIFCLFKDNTKSCNLSI